MALVKKAMAAANFSNDVLEMFYGPIEENQRLRAPVSPSIMAALKLQETISINGFVCGKCGPQKIINFSKKQKIHS